MGVPLHLIHPPCIAGIDIRGFSFDVVIADLVRNRHTNHSVIRPVFYGKVRDDLETLFVCQQFKVRFGLVDCRPEATLAKRMQDQAETFGIELWRAQYNPTPGGTIEMTRNEGEKLVTLERTMTMDCVQHAFLVGQSVVLPENFRLIAEGKMASELCSTTRVPYTSGGRDCRIWQKTGEADHAFHAFNLLFAALKLSGLESGATEMAPEQGIVVSSMENSLAGMMGREESVYLES